MITPTKQGISWLHSQGQVYGLVTLAECELAALVSSKGMEEETLVETFYMFDPNDIINAASSLIQGGFANA